MDLGASQELISVDAAKAEAGGSARVSYIPALDGLRAVAILGVLVFHTFPAALRGGFTGVDVFFVLSGFLITRVITGGITAGNFSMREFYLRRIHRLLPNAVLTVMFAVALSSVVLLPSQAVKVAQHGLWTIFNLSNVYIWRQVGGYWGDSAASVPLLHTWSLSVEEQFYIAFPAILLLATRRSTRLLTVMAWLTAASLALSLVGTTKFPTSTFYMLPTRAWEPLLGAALAVFFHERPIEGVQSIRLPGWLTQLLGWAGLGAIVTGFFLISEADHFPGVIALLPTAGALAVLISASYKAKGPARLLSTKLPVTIGKLSYSLYLWHWPLIVIGREFASITGGDAQTGAISGAALSVGLAAAAYRWVEQPLRQRGPRARQNTRIIAAGFATCFSVCLIQAVRQPLADPAGQFGKPVFSGGMYTLSLWQPARLKASTRYKDLLFPTGPALGPEPWTTGGIIHNWRGGKPRVVLLGSSHAIMYGRLIDEISRELGAPVAFLAADGTPVFFPTEVNEVFTTKAMAGGFDDARRKWVSEWHPDALIVIERWDDFAPWQAELERQLGSFLDDMAPRARNVILLSQVPVLRLGQTENLREYVTWYEGITGRVPAITADGRDGFRKASIGTLERVASRFPNVTVLRVDPRFYLADGSVRYSSGRNFLYADDDHLTDAGTFLVRDIIRAGISNALGAR